MTTLTHMQTLDQLPKGSQMYIVDMRDNKVCKELLDKGCFPGDLIVVEENQHNSQELIFKIRERRFAISKRAARSIITNIVSYEFSLN